jgi:hypothetical protein
MSTIVRIPEALDIDHRSRVYREPIREGGRLSG